MTLVTIKKRADFLAVRGGARWGTPSLLIEGKRRPAVAASDAPAPAPAHGAPARPARFGFTVTKKLGSAVVRNRIRRRLREIVRQLIGEQALPGCDYVVVARDAALRRPALDLALDVETALREVNRRLEAGLSGGKRTPHSVAGKPAASRR